jgi:hypothetical protein
MGGSMSKLHMKIYYIVQGGHTHMSIFTGSETNRGKAGTLTMTNEEFEAWKNGTMTLDFSLIAEQEKAS